MNNGMENKQVQDNPDRCNMMNNGMNNKQVRLNSNIQSDH